MTDQPYDPTESTPASAMSPPTDPGDWAPPEELSKWPKVIGIISLVYAIFGLTCVSLGSLWMVFGSQLMMKMTGMKFEIPPVMMYTTIAIMLVVFVNGFLLLLGGIKLQQRNPNAISLLKKWIVIRLVLLIIGTAVAILFMPAQVELQRSIVEQTNEMMKKQGQANRVQPVDDKTLQRKAVIQMAINTALPAAYPLFLGFYLFRKKITNEIEEWSSYTVI